MGFIKILYYLYSKINSFEYSSKVKRQALFIQTKFNKVLRAKTRFITFLKGIIKTLANKIIGRLM